MAEEDEMLEAIWTSTTNIRTEIADNRIAAHQKHGANSIEMVDPSDPMWLAIAGEEFGEWCHEWTYDSTGDKRAEALDLITVMTAWVAAYDADAVQAARGA